MNLPNALRISAIALMLTACANSTPPLAKSEPPPPDLAQPCAELPVLSDTRGATLLMWAFDVVDLYKDCADRQRGLLDAWLR